MSGPCSSKVIASWTSRPCLSSCYPRKAGTGFATTRKSSARTCKGGNDIFDMRGIDRDRGCVVVVRPDQYVADVLPLDAYADLAGFFDRFMQPAG